MKDLIRLKKTKVQNHSIHPWKDGNCVQTCLSISLGRIVKKPNSVGAVHECNQFCSTNSDGLSDQHENIIVLLSACLWSVVAVPIFTNENSSMQPPTCCLHNVKVLKCFDKAWLQLIATTIPVSQLTKLAGLRTVAVELRQLLALENGPMGRPYLPM